MLKRIISVAAAAVAILFCTEVSAQSYSSTRFGVMGGFTSSSAKIKDVTTKSVSLYHAGVTAEFPLLGGFHIQPSIIYQVKGASADNIGSVALSDFFETKVGFIEIPVQLQWGPDLMAFRPYGFVEPFVGLRINDKSEGVAEGISDKLKKAEYGLGLGVGLEISRFQLSAKYYWNFGRIYDKDGNSSSIGDTVKGTVTDLVNNGNNFNGIAVSLAVFF